MSDHPDFAALATPLLQSEERNVEKQDPLSYEHPSWRPSVSQVVEEIKELYSIALPMIMTGILLYGKSAISMLFMGRLGKDVLAGGSLAIGLANITGYSIISGLAMGTEAISSQACGAKQWPLMDQTLHRTIIILCLVSIPISLFWLNCKPFLVFLHQDPIISSIASTYLTFSLPDLVFQSFIYPLRIYLRTQNITLPLTLSSAFALALHAPITYIAIYRLNLGIQGIALASALTDFNLLASILIYLCFSPTSRKPLQRLSLGCYQEWRSVLVLALPSCVSVCLEWWWYELMIFLSGLLANPHDSVATMGILIQATSLVYIFPSALSQAVSTRVGNELGADRPNRARTSSFISLSLALITGIIAMLFMVTMRNTWGEIFAANDKSIVTLTAICMPIVGLCELGNGPQTTGCGVLRASARPGLGLRINLGSFYGVGLPMALVLAFGMNMGLLGLWLGLFSAQLVCSFLMVYVLVKTDWGLQANRARELTSGSIASY